MNKTPSSKVALMLCTEARGGMRSVVEAYQRESLFKDWHFQTLWTHCEGTPFKKIRKGLSAYFKMLGLLLQNKVSFMHVHAAMRGSFWRKCGFALTAKLFGVPSILHLHGSEMKTFYNALSPMGQRCVKWCLEQVKIVVVLSESWKKFITEIAPKANIHIINNYVTLPKEAYSEASNEVASNAQANQFDVLFLGIVGHRKGVYDLLNAWPAVLKSLPHARLLIGGNGEVEQATLIADKLGIAHSVQFLGWIDGEKKLERLKNADIFVLPSHNEGLPMSVLEAMSWSKAVVTTTVGGIPELITHQKDGLLIEAGDEVALSNAITLLGNDLHLRKQMAQQAKERIVNSYSNVSILPKLFKIYDDISFKSV